MFIEIIFWMSFILLFYTFVGYPLGLRILAATVGNETRKDETFLPSVSIVLSVYNEEEIIEAKIANFLALDYPEAMLEFIIVSDCSSDRTDNLIQMHVNKRIRLLIQDKRSGKTRNLNWGVAEAKGEIVVFTDANSMFNHDALKMLVRHFADPKIGLVSGMSVYLDATGTVTNGGIYRRYEDFIKVSESRIGGIIGADGAIYALRKNFYTPLPSKYINDFIHPIQVVVAGRLAISDEQAICCEETEEIGSSELSRQTRIMAQSWLIFFSQFSLLLKSGKLIYLWQLISHKFLRWLTVLLLVTFFITNILVISKGLFFQIVFIAQLLFISSAIVGSFSKTGFMQISYLFFILHYAAVVGLLQYIKGDIYTTWEPRKY